MRIAKFLAILFLLLLPFLSQPKLARAAVGQACCPTSRFTLPAWGSYATQEVGMTTLNNLQCGFEFPGKGLFCAAPAPGLDIVCKTQKNNCDEATEVCKYNGANPGDSICVERVVIVVPGCPGNAGDPATATYFRTAIGCIRTDPSGFVSQMIIIGISIGSGIAFLMLIYGSFKLLTSQGNPDGLNGGKEIITSAIVGLLFIILSVTIMQIVGYDILGLGSLGLGTR